MVFAFPPTDCCRRAQRLDGRRRGKGPVFPAPGVTPVSAKTPPGISAIMARVSIVILKESITPPLISRYLGNLTIFFLII
jgi:hypothetical protein